MLGVVLLLMSAVAAYDFVMANLHSQAYFDSMHYSEPQRAYFTDYPWLPLAFWALGVWGSLVGAVALLARSRLAAPLLGLATLGQVGNQAISFGLLNRWQVIGVRGSLTDLGATLLIAAAWWFAVTAPTPGRRPR